MSDAQTDRHQPTADDSQRPANVELIRLITEGRKSRPVQPSTQDILDQLDRFQAEIEAKLDQLAQSPLRPATAPGAPGPMLPWIVLTAVVASVTTLAVTQLIR